MRAAILIGPDVQCRYVANALVTVLGDRVATVVIEHGRRSLWHTLTRYPPHVTAERLITKVYRRYTRQAEQRDTVLRQTLGDQRRTWDVTNQHDTPSVNHPITRSWLHVNQQITHLFVYGTGIVGGRAIANTTALNLHSGWSPEYRGSDTEFWPLWDGRPDLVGVTVHACTSALDGGAIYARAKVPAALHEHPDHVFARQVQIGAALYADVAQQLVNGEPLAPIPQDHAIGRCYRFTDRTWWHDWQLTRRRARQS